MTLIELLILGVIAGIATAALLAGNCLEALLIFLLPIGFYAIRKGLELRKERKQKRQAQEEATQKYYADVRKRHESDSELYHKQQAYNRHRAAQLQQMNMMHQNATQAAAAQQQAAMNARQGWADPRASYGSDLADNIINLWAINSMMQSGTGVTRTHYDENTDSVKVQHVPTEQVYRSPDPEPTSSSSSYSSDTSSDSFGGSDTSSDSF